MNRIFNDAKDKNVAVVVVYEDESSNLYYDSDMTQEVPADDLFDLFAKGVVAFDGTNYKIAIGYNADLGISFATLS